nr:ERAP1-like C-terminal domain-containing protein [Nocardioidaceae bacterium]
TMRPVFELDGDDRYTSFSIEQSALDQFPTLRRHRLAVGLYYREGERLVRRRRVELDVQGDLTPVPELVGERRPDLLLVNDDDLAYTKIRLDKQSLATAVDGIGDLVESLPRALVWGAAWDMTRDAEMASRDYVRLVLSGLQSESDLTAVGALCRQAQLAVSTYSDPDARPELRTRWEAGLRDLMRRAEAGSDHQLAFTRAYAAAAHSDEAVAELRGLLDGSIVREGLDVDTDLRWVLTSALARCGTIGDAEIDAELARDSTIAGQEHAAAARASRPDAGAKEQAWQDVVVREDVPNETQRSIALAFGVPEQAELLAPYVEHYLDVAASVWESKGTYRATLILTWMFPVTVVDEATRDRVRAWLSSTDANPAARRLVSEGLADLERALRARARDAA